MTNRAKMSEKDKKLLWAKSGNRCAICKKLLVNIDDNDEKGVIVGVEAHIVAHSENGPRGKDPLPLAERHTYENIILLCTEHAKTIDERPENWSKERLLNLKKEHEILMMNLKPISIQQPRPILRLIQPVGYSGGPDGHFQTLRLKNFDKEVALDINCWISGFGFYEQLTDQSIGSFIEPGEFRDYKFRLDSSRISSQEIPLLYFNASYSNLEGQKILYKSSLIQKTVPSGAFKIIDLGDKNEFIKFAKTEVDVMIMLDSAGDYDEAEYTVDENKFKIRVSRTLLACWDMHEGNIQLCFLELGRRNMKVMSTLGVFQNKEYTTHSFPETSATGFDRFLEALELIESGKY